MFIVIKGLLVLITRTERSSPREITGVRNENTSFVTRLLTASEKSDKPRNPTQNQCCRAIFFGKDEVFMPKILTNRLV